MSPSRPAVAGAFAAIYLLWGGTFLAIRYAVAEVPPMLTIVIRCLGGAALLYLWLWLRGTRPSATGAQWRTALVAGAFLFLGCHSLLAWAEQRVSSGEAALLMTAIPLWLVLLSAVREHRVPPLWVLAGLGLGVLGVGILAGGGEPGAGGTADRLWLVFSALCWAVGSLVARHGARPASAVQSTAMQLAAGGAVVLAASALGGELGRWHPAETTLRGGLSLAFLVIGGTVLGFGAYTWLLRVTTPAAVGSYAFVNPVVALLLAWAVGDGELTGPVLVGAVTVVGAVVLTWAPAPSERARGEMNGGIASPRPPALRLPEERAGAAHAGGALQRGVR